MNDSIKIKIANFSGNVAGFRVEQLGRQPFHEFVEGLQGQRSGRRGDRGRDQVGLQGLRHQRGRIHHQRRNDLGMFSEFSPLNKYFILSHFQVMARMGFVSNKEEEATKCLNEMDLDGDGRVSYAEFMIKWKLDT